MSEIRLSRSDIIKWIAAFILAILPLLFPEQGIYTHAMKYFLAITILGLSMAAFEIVPVFVIAMIMPILWISFGVADVNVVMSPWIGTTVLMIIGALFLGASLADCGLLERIAYYLMCLVRGNFFALLVSIMIVGVLLNILTSGNGYPIMAPLAAGLVITLGGMQKKIGAAVAGAVMLGTCTSHSYTFFAGSWGVINSMGADYLATPVTPLSLLMHCWPMFVVSLLILWITYKMYKPENDLGEINYFQEKLDAMGKISRREKVNMVVMILLLVYIFTVKFHGLDLNYGYAIIPWLVYLPFFNGADEKTLKKLNWQSIFFIVSCMSIGSVAGSLGLGDAIAGFCKTMLHGSTSVISIMGMIFLIVFGLNFFMTPLAIYSLLITPILLLATEMGYDPLVFAYAVNAVSEAIIMPYEYVPYLIVYGFGMISMKEFIKWNIIRSAIFFVGFLTVIVGYWSIIGLL